MFALLLLITANNSAYINTAGSYCGDLKDKIISLGFLWGVYTATRCGKNVITGFFIFFLLFVAVVELKQFLPELSHNPCNIYDCKIYNIYIIYIAAIEATHTNKWFSSSVWI